MDEFKAYTDSVINALKENPEMKDQIYAEYRVKAMAAQKKSDEISKNFIKDNPSSLMSVILACRLDSLEENLAMIPEKNLEGILKPVVSSARKRAESKRLREEAKDKIKEGAEAPDFTLPTPDGSTLTLSALKGKYLLLDFWGSWCHWCIKGIPTLKEFYEKRGDKIEFLSIACNDTEKKWKEALETYELPWLQVRNDGDLDVSAAYAVAGYPSFYIIDPEGKIEKIFCGESDEFKAYMTELLK